jgi:hypothetical protein
MKPIDRVLPALLALLSFVYPLRAPVHAGNLPAILPNLQLTRNGTVNAISVQPDGKLIVGGTFTSISGIPHTNLARLNLDGTVDETWQVSANGLVTGFATNSTSLYVIGSFSSIGGLNRGAIARFDLSTGAIDPVWNPNPGNVSAVAVSESDVFLGGGFRFVGGQARTNLAKISATGTGTADPTWATTIDHPPYALHITGTNLYVGGYFYYVGGLSRKCLARVGTSGTGPVDTVWNPQISDGNSIYAILADGTNVYVGGQWYSGSGKQNLARFSTLSTGVVDAAWSPQPSDAVKSLLKDGFNLYVGGSFKSISGQSISNLAKITLDSGAADPSWDPGASGSVLTLARNGASLYAGGTFGCLGNITSLAVAKLDAGSAHPDTNYAPQVQIPGIVNALALQPDGKLLVGGNFALTGDTPRRNLARVNADGTLDADWNPGPNSTVSGFLVHSNDVFVAGFFSAIGGLSRNILAKLSLTGTGAVDTAWNVNIPIDANSRVNAMAAAGTNLFVAGYFSSIGGQPKNFLAKLNTLGSGAADPNWNPAPVASGWYGVESICLVGSNLFACGTFTQIGGLSRQYIAKLDPASGAADPTWDPSPLGGYVDLLAADGTNLFVGGHFTNIGWQNRKYLAKLSPAGSGDADSLWIADLNNIPYAFAIDGTNLYVGGAFSQLQGQPHHYVARLSTMDSGASDSTWDPIPNASVDALAVNGPAVYAGGSFTAVGAMARNGLALFNEDDPRPFFHSCLMTTNAFWCDVAVEPNETWKIQSSTNLLTWTDVTNLTSREPLISFPYFKTADASRCFLRLTTP